MKNQYLCEYCILYPQILEAEQNPSDPDIISDVVPRDFTEIGASSRDIRFVCRECDGPILPIDKDLNQLIKEKFEKMIIDDFNKIGKC